MNKVFKIILISLATIFSIGLLFVKPVQAQTVNNFVVQFPNGPSTPLFSEANFVPGANISSWIKIANNTNNILKIVTKATNIVNDDVINNKKFGDALNLEIKNGNTSFYNDTLSHFFSIGDISLPNLATGGVPIQYDYIISFDPNSGNEYQGKRLGFDISITGYDDSTPGGQTYTYVGGGFSTTTTTNLTTTTTSITTTRPGVVAGAQTEDLSSEGGIRQGAQNTTTTTTTTPGVVLGAATERITSCRANLIFTGMNPLLASLFCLGQNVCSSCISPWLVLLLGLVITFGCAILAKKHHEYYE